MSNIIHHNSLCLAPAGEKKENCISPQKYSNYRQVQLTWIFLSITMASGSAVMPTQSRLCLSATLYKDTNYNFGRASFSSKKCIVSSSDKSAPPPPPPPPQEKPLLSDTKWGHCRLVIQAQRKVTLAVHKSRGKLHLMSLCNNFPNLCVLPSYNIFSFFLPSK